MVTANDPELAKLVTLMTKYMGRMPTDDEVYRFIMGEEDERREILGMDPLEKK